MITEYNKYAKDFYFCEEYFNYLLTNPLAPKFDSEDIWEMIDGFEVDNVPGEEYRWHKEITSICKINNKYYAVNWYAGLTEHQENEWDIGDQPYEVRPEEKIITIKDWIPVK